MRFDGGDARRRTQVVLSEEGDLLAQAKGELLQILPVGALSDRAGLVHALPNTKVEDGREELVVSSALHQADGAAERPPHRFLGEGHGALQADPSSHGDGHVERRGALAPARQDGALSLPEADPSRGAGEEVSRHPKLFTGLFGV